MVTASPPIARVGILGAAGYTGGELLRLLLLHDRVSVDFVQSRSQAGRPVSSVHTDLRGQTHLVFSDAAGLPELDALFLAFPHGESRKFLSENPLPGNPAVIDLSSDFRLRRDAVLPSDGAPRTFVYGLPEARREEIRRARSVANPGCFASAIQFALLPLARHGLLRPVSVTGITGSTGAGQKPQETSHFSFRANNVQPYKTLQHQHVPEVEETLSTVQGSSASGLVSFIPWRGDFTRGIFVSAQLECSRTMEELLSLYQGDYEPHPFVEVVPGPIDMKSVVNTNRVLIGVEKAGSRLAVHCALDNLLKGASGQAVQNFNLMMGYPEDLGLRLKGAAF